MAKQSRESILEEIIQKGKEVLNTIDEGDKILSPR